MKNYGRWYLKPDKFKRIISGAATPNTASELANDTTSNSNSHQTATYYKNREDLHKSEYNEF